MMDDRQAMEEESSSGNSRSATPNFDFDFNSINFSDRVLRIEIVADEEKQDCEDLHGGENVPSMLGSRTVLSVKTLFISSEILAGKSPFFYKLFTNGMRESEQRYSTLQILQSEEVSLMDLLRYMYGRNLSSTTPDELLKVLITADKYEVASCIRHCSELLCNFSMTIDSALRYLNLPCIMSMESELKSLIESSNRCLISHYNDITKFHDEIMQLPLMGIKAILSNDHLVVFNEDAVYDFLLKWAKWHYPNREDRKRILNSLLTQEVVRFPHMSCRKLKKALTCDEFDQEIATNLIIEALFFKSETCHKECVLAPDKNHHLYIQRFYKYRPVMFLEFDSPHQQCIVFMDLKQEECANLFPSGRIYSESFRFAGLSFFLSAHCNRERNELSESFGLFLGMQERGQMKVYVDYEYAARVMPNGEFMENHKGSYPLIPGKAVGYRNLFGIPWSDFIHNNSPYFINGTLHLRAQLTLTMQKDDPRRPENHHHHHHHGE